MTCRIQMLQSVFFSNLSTLTTMKYRVNRFHSIQVGMYLALLLSLPCTGKSQCQDNLAWGDIWTSCTQTPNPNNLRGLSHWLQYDLGAAYQLSSLHLWNANQPGATLQGVKTLAIDVSDDGENWEDLGTFAVKQANGQDYYSGDRIEQFPETNTRFLLLTVLETLGDPSCTGIHELRLELGPLADPEAHDILVYPNPASDILTITWESMEQETVGISLHTLMGQEITSDFGLAQPGRFEITVDLPEVVPGIYFVRVIGEDDRLLGRKMIYIHRDQ